jgi:hypothetical protein
MSLEDIDVSFIKHAELIKSIELSAENNYLILCKNDSKTDLYSFVLGINLYIFLIKIISY